MGRSRLFGDKEMQMEVGPLAEGLDDGDDPGHEVRIFCKRSTT
jgi:hypothetical protein